MSKNKDYLRGLRGSLASYYKLSGNTNNEVGAAGTPYNITYANDGIGTSAVFNGLNSHIDCPGTDLANSSFTISLLAKLASVNEWRFMYRQGSVQAANQDLMLGFLGSSLSYRLYLGFNSNDLYSDFCPDTNAWYHIVTSFDVATKKRTIYVDSAKRGEDISPSNYLGSGKEAIGYIRSSTPPTGYFNGSLAEVAIWQRCLSTEEVSTLYNRYKHNML